LEIKGEPPIIILGFRGKSKELLSQAVDLIRDEFPPHRPTIIRPAPVGVAAVSLITKSLLLDPEAVDFLADLAEKEPHRKKEMLLETVLLLGHELGHVYMGRQEWKADRYAQICYDKAKERLGV